jgi:hypothetical protein
MSVSRYSLLDKKVAEAIAISIDAGLSRQDGVQQIGNVGTCAYEELDCIEPVRPMTIRSKTWRIFKDSVSQRLHVRNQPGGSIIQAFASAIAD